MIIFNLKAVLVALAVAVPFVILSLLEFNLGLSIFLSGLAGLFTTVKLSTKGEGYSAMPTVFFVPTHVYTVLICILGAISFFDEPGLFTATKGDLRVEMLDQDIQLLDAEELSGDEEKASLVKDALQYFLVSEMEAENLHCLVRKDVDGDKTLILVKLKKIGDVAKETRPDLVEFLEDLFAQDLDYFGSETYIGVKGSSDFYLVKAGGELINTNFASTKSLLTFYAPEKIKK